MKYLTLTIAIAFLSLNLSAAHHEEPKGIGGLISSEVFDLAGEMNLHVEKYQSCGDSANQKHYHPVGTLVYVINGKGASNSSGEWKTYTDTLISVFNIFRRLQENDENDFHITTLEDAKKIDEWMEPILWNYNNYYEKRCYFYDL